jgi:hypothetical protein
MAQSKKSAQFSVSEDVYWQLKELALKKKKTLSVFLRDAVQHYLDHEGLKIDLSEDLETWGGKRRGDSDKEDEA